jgi:hypothetical protein
VYEFSSDLGNGWVSNKREKKKREGLKVPGCVFFISQPTPSNTSCVASAFSSHHVFVCRASVPFQLPASFYHILHICLISVSKEKYHRQKSRVWSTVVCSCGV